MRRLQEFLLALSFFCLPTNLLGEKSDALQYSLVDADGARHTQREWARARAAVFVFIGTECPISNRYAPEINRLVNLYAHKNILFFAVHSDADTDAAAAKRHSLAFGYKIPALLDPTQQLASHFYVQVTPTAVIVTPKKGLVYRGRIDNRQVDFGKSLSDGVTPDLKLALGAVLAGRPVHSPSSAPIGCDLPPARSDR